MLSAVAGHKLLQGLRLPGDVLCERGSRVTCSVNPAPRQPETGFRGSGEEQFSFEKSLLIFLILEEIRAH